LEQAISDPYRWATEYTQTYNEHWQEEGRPSPYEPFPQRLPYLEPLLQVFELERIIWIVKSRDMKRACFMPECEFNTIPKSKLIADGAKVILYDKLSRADGLRDFTIFEALRDQFDSRRVDVIREDVEAFALRAEH